MHLSYVFLLNLKLLNHLCRQLIYLIFDINALFRIWTKIGSLSIKHNGLIGNLLELSLAGIIPRIINKFKHILYY